MRMLLAISLVLTLTSCDDGVTKRVPDRLPAAGEKSTAKPPIPTKAEEELPAEKPEEPDLEQAEIQAKIQQKKKELRDIEQKLKAERQRLSAIDEEFGRLDEHERDEVRQFGRRKERGEQFTRAELMRLRELGPLGAGEFVDKELKRLDERIEAALALLTDSEKRRIAAIETTLKQGEQLGKGDRELILGLFRPILFDLYVSVAKENLNRAFANSEKVLDFLEISPKLRQQFYIQRDGGRRVMVLMYGRQMMKDPDAFLANEGKFRVARDDIYLRGKLIDLKRNKSTVKRYKANLEKEFFDRDRVRKEKRARELSTSEDKAALKLAELREAITDGDNIDDIRKKFQTIAKAHPDTKTSEAATSEVKAISKLKFAQKFLDSGNTGKAKKWLGDLLKQHAGTVAATRAEKILADIP